MFSLSSYNSPDLLSGSISRIFGSLCFHLSHPPLYRSHVRLPSHGSHARLCLAFFSHVYMLSCCFANARRRVLLDVISIIIIYAYVYKNIIIFTNSWSREFFHGPARHVTCGGGCWMLTCTLIRVKDWENCLTCAAQLMSPGVFGFQLVLSTVTAP